MIETTLIKLAQAVEAGSGKTVISKQLYWGLFASMIIVAVLGLAVFLGTYLKTISMKKKIDKERKEATEKAVMDQKGSALGQIPEYIDKTFAPNIDPLDRMQLINTIYLNRAKNVLLAGQDLENIYLSLTKMTLANIEVEETGINEEIWNKGAMRNLEEINSYPNYQDPEKTISYDLVYVIESNLNSFEIFKKYYPQLRTDGMLVVIQNPSTKVDLKLLAKELKQQQIRYEISKNKAQFLYVIKMDETLNTNI
ncbi:BC85_0335 family putative methyltransferase [Mycoplasmopsis adleri]|uniref:BC85_0335 family putative methyltransferase n=1 Tax=Mycoplasmopsis adleri TaxID=51362 RepID=UPI003873A52E